jgi:hypothetical protein
VKNCIKSFESHPIVNFLWSSKKWKGVEEKENFLLNCLSREAELGVGSGSACASAQSKARKILFIIGKIFCARPLKMFQFLRALSPPLAERAAGWGGAPQARHFSKS